MYFKNVFNNANRKPIMQMAYMAAARYVLAVKCGVLFTPPSLNADDNLSANKVRFGGEDRDLSASPADWPYAFGIAILTVLSGMAMACLLGQMDAEGYELDEDATHLYRKRWTRPNTFTTEDNATYNRVLEAINKHDFPQHYVGMDEWQYRYLINNQLGRLQRCISGRALTMILLNRTAIRLVAQAMLDGKTLTQDTAEQLIAEAEQIDRKAHAEANKWIGNKAA